MVCGINAFNLSDLTRPEPVRFRTVLSGIMNFAKFRYVGMYIASQGGRALTLGAERDDHSSENLCNIAFKPRQTSEFALLASRCG